MNSTMSPSSSLPTFFDKIIYYNFLRKFENTRTYFNIVYEHRYLYESANTAALTRVPHILARKPNMLGRAFNARDGVSSKYCMTSCHLWVVPTNIIMQLTFELVTSHVVMPSDNNKLYFWQLVQMPRSIWKKQSIDNFTRI